MSVNFTQKPEYINQQNNFGAGNFPAPEAPHQYGMLKGMGLPSNGDEFIKFSPFFIGAFGISKFISHLATMASRINPKKSNSNLTVAQSFDNSKLGRLASKIDEKIIPLANKYSKQINSTKSFFSKYTPNWVNNLIEKVKIGITPKNRMALSQYKGMTVMSAETMLGEFKNLAPDVLKKYHIGSILEKNISEVSKVQELSKLLAKMPAQKLQALKSASGKSLKLLDELNKSKAFIAANAKTPISKAIQKGFMCVSEAAGGGVIGNSIFGIVMNSIFLASTLKRTWDAPWGEKLSTFMEGALVDFCGGYLMALLGTKITYKLLGIKNIDKTAKQIKDIKAMGEAIKLAKEQNKAIPHMIKAFKSKQVTPELLLAAKSMGLTIPQLKSSKSAIKALEKLAKGKYSADTINAMIDNLANARKFQKQGFFKDLLNRPLRWIGNFLSTGLESLPAKVAGGKVSGFRVGLQKFKNSFKFLAGYPLRFLLVLMVVTPPLTKLCAKISHTLFGKPSKSIMDSEEENNNNKQAQGKDPYFVNINDFSGFTKAAGMMKQMNQSNNTQQTKLAEGTISPTMINSALVSQKERLSKTDTQNISPATYVPNITPTDFTNTNLENAINEKVKLADSVERYAQRELASVKKKQSFDY